MREILFRGKAINRNENYSYRTNYKNGDWVYGLFAGVNEYTGFSLMTNTDGVSGIEVDTKTIGQYTGLKDKNGTKIFEGDICKNTENGNTAVVQWYEEHAAYLLYSKHKNLLYWFSDNDFSKIEVIGNIHDNPELLEVTSDE